jgi:hypothetical protein
MIKRILVIGSLGLAVAGGARFALVEMTERRWERRREELLGMAVFPPAERRPWEVRFESLAERVASSPRVDEILDSPYRPFVCLGDGEPRALDDFERVWVASLWDELFGLEGILTELRKLPPDALAWNGETQELQVLRVLVHALCGRAWLALADGEPEAAAEAWADALRLVRATDSGTAIATLARSACDGMSLGSLRSALALGMSPGALRAALAPLLEGWAYDPERAERMIRRDLTAVAELQQSGATELDPAGALRWLAPVERAIELAHGPVEAVARMREQEAESRDSGGGSDARDALWLLGTPVSYHHALHAQRNVALTALAVAAFREARGAFPATLAELTDLPPAHALDPLTGARLPYSVSGDTARIGPAAWGERVDVWNDIDGSPYVWTLR